MNEQIEEKLFPEAHKQQEEKQTAIQAAPPRSEPWRVGAVVVVVMLIAVVSTWLIWWQYKHPHIVTVEVES